MELALLAGLSNGYDYAEPQVSGVTSMGFLSDEDRAKLSNEKLIPVPLRGTVALGHPGT
jgi:hypothetical protein